MTDRPTVVCLCGSTRFKRAYLEQTKRLTMAGQIVLSVGLFGHADRVPLTADEKAALDDLHLRKIDMADRVFVVDVGGYVGESTRREIEYARSLGKPVEFLSDEFPDYQEPADESLRALDLVRALATGRCPVCDDYVRVSRWMHTGLLAEARCACGWHVEAEEFV